MKNILFIMGDQHRFDCIGVSGNKDIKTPNLDNISQDGVLYNNHYTTYPVCTPSRYSLLSGLYTHQHLGWGNHCTLAVGLPTYAKVLRNHGYKTAAIGKMHATPTYLDMGFDKMLLAEQDGDGRFDDDYHRYLMEKGLVDTNDIVDQRQEFRKNADKEYWETYGSIVSNLDEKHHSTRWITNKALEEIEDWTSTNNMMLVSYVKPHHPFDPPAPYDTMYDPNEIEILPGYTDEISAEDYEHSSGYFDHKGLNEKRLKKIMSHYYGSISHMDHHIGRIIDKLKEKELYEDTLIIYTSDHGEYMGFHHMLLKGNYMYDPLVKVPLIMKFPKNSHKGSINSLISNNTDIAPTIIKQAGLEVPNEMKGLDLKDQECGREMTVCEDLRVDHSIEGNPSYYEYMVRSEKYKLIIRKNFKNYKFFDLVKDPLEFKDVSKDLSYKTEIDRHIAYLTQMMVFDDVSPIYLNKEEQTYKTDKQTNYEERKKVETYYKSKLPHTEI